MHQWLVRYIEIKNAINEIYIGNTEVHLDEKRYKGSLNSMAIQVNDIAGGLSNAIQEKIKNRIAVIGIAYIKETHDFKALFENQ